MVAALAMCKLPCLSYVHGGCSQANYDASTVYHASLTGSALKSMTSRQFLYSTVLMYISHPRFIRFPSFIITV